MPYAQDGTITYEILINRYNSDLANTLGNLVNRTVSMVNKYFEGIIPAPGNSTDFDSSLSNTCIECSEKIVKTMDTLRVSDSLDQIWKIVDRSNKYIDETTPWILAKTDEGKRNSKNCNVQSYRSDKIYHISSTALPA